MRAHTDQRLPGNGWPTSGSTSARAATGLAWIAPHWSGFRSTHRAASQEPAPAGYKQTVGGLTEIYSVLVSLKAGEWGRHQLGKNNHGVLNAGIAVKSVLCSKAKSERQQTFKRLDELALQRLERAGESVSSHLYSGVIQRHCEKHRNVKMELWCQVITMS